MLDTFLELAHLLPAVRLHIHMVGPHVPSHLHASTLQLQAPPAAATHTQSVVSTAGAETAAWTAVGPGIPDAAAGPAASAGSPAPTVPAASLAPASAEGAGGAPVNKPSALSATPSFLLLPATLSISFHRGPLHDVLDSTPQLAALLDGPERDSVVAFAPNAGIPAYLSWLPTLQRLMAPSSPEASCIDQTDAGASAGPGSTQNSIPGSLQGYPRQAQHHSRGPAGAAPSSEAMQRCRIPVIITDYCEEALVRSRQVLVGALGLKPVGQPFLNGFRQPLASTAGGNALPACSNGFMMALAL